MGRETGSSPSRRICGNLGPESGCAGCSTGSSWSRRPEGSVWSNAAAPYEPASGEACPAKPSACSGGPGSGSCSGAVTIGSAGCSLSRGRDGALARGFRMTRLLTTFDLAAGLGLRLTSVAGFFVLLLLARLALARGAFRRGVLVFLRVTRRIARAAGFTAFAERGFFFFIRGSDPFGGCRVLSDAHEITGSTRAVQRQIPGEYHLADSAPGANMKPCEPTPDGAEGGNGSATSTE